MVGWHHWLNRHEFEQALGVGDEQGSLACYSHGVTKSRTGLSDWTELINRWHVFDGHRGFFQAPWVPNQLTNDLWITMNEHLETFLNVGNLALVNASFYLGLLLVFSVNLKKKKNKKYNKNKAILFLLLYKLSPLPCNYNFVFLLAGHRMCSGGSTLYCYLRLSLFMFITVTSFLSPFSSLITAFKCTVSAMVCFNCFISI